MKTVYKLPLYATFLATALYSSDIKLDVVEIKDSHEANILEERLIKDTAQLAKEARGETLGDYLQNEQFVESASYGPAVGRPVVRGMDGYRVGITNGNVILNDMSAMSQDHAVGVMPRATSKIELVKGPASLLYGNYTGGVVRVMGEEHNKNMIKSGYSLDATSSYGSNGAGVMSGGVIQAREGDFSIYANTFYHDANNYKDGNNNEIKSSNTLSTQSHVVLGYRVDDHNIIKVYADKSHKNYGIPNSTLEATSIKMDQDRYGGIWHIKDLSDTIEHIQTEIQASQYVHSEIEGGSYDGRFGQKQFSISTMIGLNVSDWHIDANLEYQKSELKVCHEHGKCTSFYNAERTAQTDGESLENYLNATGLPFSHGHPMPDTSESLVKSGLSFKKFYDESNEVTFALRGEARSLKPNSKNIQETWLVNDRVDASFYDAKNDFAFSASAGWFSYLSNNLSFQSSLSYVERLPSAIEMFWNGFHHATDTYIFGDKNLKNERSVNLDVDFMHTQDNLTTALSGFYYHFFNYIYQKPTVNTSNNLVRDPFHNSSVWSMEGEEARVFGLALKESYKQEISSHTLEPSIGIEAIRGVLSDGSNIPRIPTYSATLGLKHSYKKYKGNISYKLVDKSRYEGINESATDGYGWLSTLITYDDKNRYFNYTLFLKGENLTNEMARNHLSFLKATAPYAGRQITFGLDIKL